MGRPPLSSSPAPARAAQLVVLLIAATLVALCRPAAAQPYGWSKPFPNTRRSPGVAYDSERGVTIVAGGNSYGQSIEGPEVWELRDQNWTLRDLRTAIPYAGKPLIYDSARGVCVGFYGSHTWEWDGDTWTDRLVPGPEVRGGPALAYDSARGVTVLFGGWYYDSSSNRRFYSDTWEWNGNAWIRQAVTGPSGRAYTQMAYDIGRGVVVLFGGEYQPFGPNTVTALGDTWEWNGTIWTQRATNGPESRYDGGIAYDAARGVTVIAGGRSTFSVESTTWEWDGTTWVLKSTDSRIRRFSHSMAYDSRRRSVVLFGGPPDEAVLDWDGANWTERVASGPVARIAGAMVYDSQRGESVMFGGQKQHYLYTAETWAFDGRQWTLRSSAGPSERSSPAMAYDPDRAVTVLFGGIFGTNQVSGETWEWDGSIWNQRAVAGPPPRARHAMVYDTARRVTVLFGGWAGSVALGDTWEWDGTVWTQRASSGPSPRYRHAMVYDSDRGVSVLFGGQRTSPTTENDETWEWDGSTWTRRLVPGPSPRSGHAMAYDPVRHVAVLAGGDSTAYPVTYYKDVWEWNGTEWSRQPWTVPSVRSRHAMTYDRGIGAILLFGGDTYEYQTYECGDTWELRLPACYANCDGSAASPMLNVSDFICFLNRFVAGDPYANCDGSTQAPTLDIQDFHCFMDRFAAGCP